MFKNDEIMEVAKYIYVYQNQEIDTRKIWLTEKSLAQFRWLRVWDDAYPRRFGSIGSRFATRGGVWNELGALPKNLYPTLIFSVGVL